MQLLWHLICFDELLIMCNVGKASKKINNCIIDRGIQFYLAFFKLWNQQAIEIMDFLLVSFFPPVPPELFFF